MTPIQTMSIILGSTRVKINVEDNANFNNLFFMTVFRKGSVLCVDCDTVTIAALMPNTPFLSSQPQ